ncbi:hypothetical protein HFP72_02955 [Nocardiopsis sp. ARC36]
MSDDLSVSVDGHVGVLEFRRPPNNHFDLALLRDLADAAAELEDARGAAPSSCAPRAGTSAPGWTSAARGSGPTRPPP